MAIEQLLPKEKASDKLEIRCSFKKREYIVAAKGIIPFTKRPMEVFKRAEAEGESEAIEVAVGFYTKLGKGEFRTLRGALKSFK